MSLKVIRAVVVLPGTATILIPALVVFAAGHTVHPVAALPGTLLIGFGLFLMVQTIRMFSQIGKGTLAPWNPTQKLVVAGVYRHVRNPMITGVACILGGEALVFFSPWLAGWWVVFVIANAIYMPIVEEPGLRKRFGEEYEVYTQNVPRWIPRLRSWDPTD